MTEPRPTVQEVMQQAISHHRAQEWAEADRLYRAILAADPGHPAANHNLGVLAIQIGQAKLGLPHLKAALEASPSNAQYCLSYIEGLLASGKPGEAKSFLQSAIPRGLASPAADELGTRIDDRLRAISADPRDHEYEMADLLAAARLQLEGGRLEEAESLFQRILTTAPEHAEALHLAGVVAHKQGRFDEAVAFYRRALDVQSSQPDLLSNLGTSLHALGQESEAVACYEQALAIDPTLWDVLRNLAGSLHALGRSEEAMAAYDRILVNRPDDAVTCGNLLIVSGAQPSFDAARHLGWARRWEQAKLGGMAVPRPGQLPRRPLAGRRLRVGYMSGNFGRHAISHFVEQLFARHDRSRVELFAYATSLYEDEVTPRLRAATDHWVQLTPVSDIAACQRIRADEIDVLIDLSGWTLENRLGIFALRAAPVQAHYLGYYASTGISQMDYWIGDEIVTPIENDAEFSERVWRLPRVWVSYDARNEAPPSNWRPAADGTFWLGSFNTRAKLTSPTLQFWGRLLQALPEARLVIKTDGLERPATRHRILADIQSQGVAESRIELVERSVTPDWHRHMAYYDRLDLALDPVGGVGGGTTTCDALWMGVPVITLEGSRMPTRMTSSMLHAIGRPEWIAQDERDYIAKVVRLARDVDGRRVMRGEQRARMLASPLCDATGLARALEEAFVAMYELSPVRASDAGAVRRP